jgi:signal transduction histidine kinase
MLAVAANPAPPPLLTAEVLATLALGLRDPHAAILLALELHSGESDPAGRRPLTMVAHQILRVVRLVDDLFDLCAGSLDSLPRRKEVVELAEVCVEFPECYAAILQRYSDETPNGAILRLATARGKQWLN